MSTGRAIMVTFSVTFVRHGETLYNRRNIIQGQTDIPLSTIGEQQAELVASRLQNERFSHIFASDLTRAYDTAKIIAKANKVCRCDITIDKRLRERKFGSAEGKSSKELLLSVKKSKRRYIDYTPPGAETIAQVQERVISFFKDICTLCSEYRVEDESPPCPPGKIKRRHGGSLGRNSGPNKRLEISRRSQSFCGAGSIQNFINEINMGPDFENEDNDINDNNINFCDHDSYLIEESDNSDKIIESYNYREYVPSGSDDSNISSDLKSTSSSDNSLASDPDDLSPNDSEETSTITQGDSEPENIQDTIDFEPDCKTLPSAQEEFDYMVQRKSKKLDQGEGLSFLECPNVSLSPTMPNRLSSISSMSSGRNSSFDDLDSVPTNVADILIVSHGGYIKETMRYFVERLDCKIPGMKGHAYKVCPNCSVSKFVISLDNSGNPSLTCITIHDKDHLVNLDITEAKGAY